MSAFLAYADTTDSSQSNITLVLAGALIVGAIGISAFLPVAVANRRHHKFAGPILAAAIFWSLLTASSTLSVLLDQLKWSGEQALRLESGYYTGAQARQDAPTFPWSVWAILGAAYVALNIWSMSARRPRPVGPL